MASASNRRTEIVRAERGLTISGTRITLYDVMDYIVAQYPPKFIQGLFELTEEQVKVALAYIEINRAEVEAEYQQVLEEADELQQHYRNGSMKGKNFLEQVIREENTSISLPVVTGKI